MEILFLSNLVWLISQLVGFKILPAIAGRQPYIEGPLILNNVVYNCTLHVLPFK